CSLLAARGAPVCAATAGVVSPPGVGNGVPPPAVSGWAGRAQRAHRNMLENLPLFIALVLVAQIAGKTNATTLIGAHLFFWGRLAHWLIYLAGIAWLRTLAWLVSVIGLLMIFLQLL